MRGGMNGGRNKTIERECFDTFATLEAKKKEIAELEKKKANLSEEIKKAISEAVEKLEGQYQEKFEDLDITYQSKFSDINRVKDELLREKGILIEKDAKIISERKTLDSDKEIQKEEKKRISNLRDNIVLFEKNAHQATDEQRQYNEETRRALIAEKEALNKREKGLDQASFDLSIKEKRLNHLEAEVKAQKGLNETSKNNAKLLQERAENLNKSVQANIKKTVDLKEGAERIFKKASEIQDQADDNFKRSEEGEARVKKLSDNLSALRDKLNEQDISLREKERAQLLKAREIDGKIAILKKLREES